MSINTGNARDVDAGGDLPFEVRPGRREDADAAARLWMQSARAHADYDPVYKPSPDAEKMMRRFLADLSSANHSFLFVADVTEGGPEAARKTVGFVSGELREGSPTFEPRSWAAVDDVFVEPAYRSLGIGHALMERVRRWAEERRTDGISLQVASANERGRSFYRDLGFREVSVYEVREL